MAQVTITHDAGITVEVVAGPLPVDQSAQVAALSEQVAALQAKIAAARAAAQIAKDADAASVDGQNILDALA